MLMIKKDGTKYICESFRIEQAQHENKFLIYLKNKTTIFMTLPIRKWSVERVGRIPFSLLSMADNCIMLEREFFGSSVTVVKSRMGSKGTFNIGFSVLSGVYECKCPITA